MIDLAGSIEDQRTGQGAEGCVKTANDLARYRKLLAAVKPAWVVECGTFSGKSACWLADVAQCHVVTIDTHPQVAPEIHGHHAVTWLKGNTLDEVDKVRRIIGNDTPVLVVLDSDHSAKHVYAEMMAYGPLVTAGSYMVVEDGIVRWLPEQLAVYDNSSPLDAIERFLIGHPHDWEIDMHLEDMLPMTQNPSGWLRRVL